MTVDAIRERPASAATRDLMADHWRFTGAAIPLAIYFFILAVWHGGRHPRVVSGAADFALLAFGLGGVVLFGPFGQSLARLVAGRPAAAGWIMLGSGLGLAWLWFGRRVRRRLVVYHVDAPTFQRIFLETLDEIPGNYMRTLRGLEDLHRRKGVAFEIAPRLRTVTIEAFGAEPEAFVRDLAAQLRRRFRATDAIPSRVPWLFLGASALVLSVTLAYRLTDDPHAREVIRALLQRFTKAAPMH